MYGDAARKVVGAEIRVVGWSLVVVVHLWVVGVGVDFIFVHLLAQPPNTKVCQRTWLACEVN